MLIKSYLVFPDPGKSKLVTQKLTAIAGCETHPAQNSELIVLTLESMNRDDEKMKQQSIAEIPEITSLSLVFAHADQEAGERP